MVLSIKSKKNTMQNIKIYIARHGQNQDNARGILNGHRDMPLTTLGIEQANDLAKSISELGITFNRVFSSPLDRAYRTAKIISRELTMRRIVKLRLLIERDFGIMTGKPASQIEALCGDNIIKIETITYFLSPEGAETFPDLIKRAQRILKKLEEFNLNGNILLVCHGDIGKMIYAAFYNIHWKDILTTFHFGNSELLLLEKDSDPEKRHIVKLKQHNH